MVIWILIFVGLAFAPSCSSSVPNNTHYYKSTPTAQSPSPSHSSPHYYPIPILKKGKKKPPPTPPSPPPSPLVTPFDYFKLPETWPTSFCLAENFVNPPPSPVMRFTLQGLWPSNKTNPQFSIKLNDVVHVSANLK
ncbi:S6 RNase [Trifolium pratense]|uniref:S6 RNase n=1 Tax=Trifolium pratense TaxID=57577 RepID=A0A2K3LPR3_TRIPR|nr:S6 RNase [Trifolium pratense]PNX96261.1 S6 RNase [Trifolium pratense]